MPTQNKYGYQLPTPKVPVKFDTFHPDRPVKYKTVLSHVLGKPINPNGGTVIGRKELSRRDLHRMNVASKKARRVITINK
jgi:hypothetical protein